jgi:hypothetical protein
MSTARKTSATMARLAASVLLASAGLAQAQDAYEGYYWGRTAGYWQGRDISGNGPYGTGHYGERGGGGLVSWSGPGSHNAPSGLGHWVDAPTTVSFESDPAGEQWGNTFAGGSLTLPAAAAFPAVIRSSIHLYGVLGENPGGESTFTNADVSGSFYTNNSQQPRQPLYWHIDYRMRVDGTAHFIGQGRVDFAGLGSGAVLSAGAGSFSGVLDTAPQNFWESRLIVPFGAAVGAMDRGGLPATGRVDLWVDVYLSRSPITAPPVPEPGTWALMAIGLLALGGAARRRRR